MSDDEEYKDVNQEGGGAFEIDSSEESEPRETLASASRPTTGDIDVPVSGMRQVKGRTALSIGQAKKGKGGRGGGAVADRQPRLGKDLESDVARLPETVQQLLGPDSARIGSLFDKLIGGVPSSKTWSDEAVDLLRRSDDEAMMLKLFLFGCAYRYTYESRLPTQFAKLKARLDSDYRGLYGGIIEQLRIEQRLGVGNGEAIGGLLAPHHFAVTSLINSDATKYTEALTNATSQAMSHLKSTAFMDNLGKTFKYADELYVRSRGGDADALDATIRAAGISYLDKTAQLIQEQLQSGQYNEPTVLAVRGYLDYYRAITAEPEEVPAAQIYIRNALYAFGITEIYGKHSNVLLSSVQSEIESGGLVLPTTLSAPLMLLNRIMLIKLRDPNYGLDQSLCLPVGALKWLSIRFNPTSSNWRDFFQNVIDCVESEYASLP